MTTPCEVLLISDNKSKADETAQEILKEAKRLQKRYNYFDPDSYLSALNRRKSDVLDFETKQLLQRAVKYYTLTEGVFDITLATLKDLYARAQTLAELEEGKKRLLSFTGCEHIKIRRNRLMFDNPQTKIDLGGFVKEYAVDQAVRIVKKAKIKAALINFGGDIYALGKKPDGLSFRIGIKNPHDPETFVRFEEIENAALTTSASYERNRKLEGTTLSHIMTKKEVSVRASSVTVISPNCVESGVYSTALMVDPDISCKHKVILL